MKKSLYAAIGVLFLFAASSCRKDLGHFPQQNPLTSDYQVAECHATEYDEWLGYAHYPFKKTYDHSGHTVVGIDCGFEDDRSYLTFQQSFYKSYTVSQKGQMVYLIKKTLSPGGGHDTAIWLTLNGAGRPQSLKSDTSLIYDLLDYWPPQYLIQNYVYKDNRIIAVNNILNEPHHGNPTDSIKYDQYGNVILFNGNTWTYDYTRTAKQQFYYEGLTGPDEPFYLLIYLGYFPEISSPTNLLISYTDYQSHTVSNHQFDRQGRLISYDDGNGHVTVNWK
jgi:hypothetical protein